MFKAPYGLNFTTILDFLSVNENKNKQTNKQTKLAVVSRLFWQFGPRLVAVVDRFKQESMYGLSAMTKQKCDCCREVAISGGSTVNGIMSLSNNYKRLFKKYWRIKHLVSEKGFE